MKLQIISKTYKERGGGGRPALMISWKPDKNYKQNFSQAAVQGNSLPLGSAFEEVRGSVA